MVLPGEALCRQPIEGRPAPVPAIGIIIVPGPTHHSRLGDQRAAAAEVVGQAVEHAVVGGVPRPPQPVALVVERRRRSLLLVNAGDVDSGDAVDRALDPVAFGVVDDTGAGPCAGNGVSRSAGYSLL